MSVRGEFARILGDATASLRVAGDLELADALERAGNGSQQDLGGAARRVLGLIGCGAQALTQLHGLCIIEA